MGKMTYVPSNSLQHCYNNKKLETTQTSTIRELIKQIIQRETYKLKNKTNYILYEKIFCEDLHC